ncbi:hypothetical protein NKJ26_03140 [Mesorhizobium sp. M0152]|uniref:hypothetical protein n=1 Tax=Mesorhizobium sp. M0152 TaxID=2956898 RepID=UPI0033352F0E
MIVVKLNASGLHRVLDGKIGMTFIVDAFTESLSGGNIAHVRDYRYPQEGRPWQIWNIGPEGYDILTPDPLRWEPDPDPVTDGDLLAFAGDVPVGGVKRSGSGRYRWEIVSLPGNPPLRDHRAGWLETEADAKAKVQELWDDWSRRAAS